MKRLTAAVIIVLALSVAAYAQMGDMGGGKEAGQEQGMKMGEGKMMCPKMEGMKGMQGMMEGMQGGPHMQHCGAMGKEMMETVVEILDNQEKIINGVKPEEKEAIIRDIRQMKGKVQGMMAVCKDMMTSGGKGHHPMAAPAPESKEMEMPAKMGAH